MTLSTYQVPLRATYDERAHDIVVRLGRGRRPRPVVSTMPAEAIVELDARGRLVGVMLLDNKFLHLGQRLSGLPELPPDLPAPDTDAIVYDLAGRLARLCIQATTAEPQRVTRPVRLDFDAQERLLAVHIPVVGNRRRDPDLFVALGYLVRAGEDVA